jgi:hypothetical protein
MNTIDQQVDRPEARRVVGSAAISAALDTVVVFAALGWGYVAVIAVLHPYQLGIPILSWMPIRRDTFGIVCFAVSAVANFIRVLRRPSIGRDDV